MIYWKFTDRKKLNSCQVYYKHWFHLYDFYWNWIIGILCHRQWKSGFGMQVTLWYWLFLFLIACIDGGNKFSYTTHHMQSKPVPAASFEETSIRKIIIEKCQRRKGTYLGDPNSLSEYCCLCTECEAPACGPTYKILMMKILVPKLGWYKNENILGQQHNVTYNRLWDNYYIGWIILITTA